jgi:hypothetical protein
MTDHIDGYTSGLVMPAQAGIQCFVDAGIRRDDDN